MSEIALASQPDSLIRAAGGFAIVSGIVSTLGVVLIILTALFASPNRSLALTFRLLNDICVTVQYLLTIPIAPALYRILLPYNPTLIRIATFVGIVSLLVVIGLQLALIYGAIPIRRQIIWISLTIIVGVGSWLMVTGIVARSTASLPNSVLMSAVAVPYLGYPAWAFWLGWQDRKSVV